MQMLSVRTSFQTMSGWSGFPVFLSHTRVLSLWLVIPTAARSEGSRRAICRADLTQCPTLRFFLLAWRQRRQQRQHGSKTKEARRNKVSTGNGWDKGTGDGLTIPINWGMSV